MQWNQQLYQNLVPSLIQGLKTNGCLLMRMKCLVRWCVKRCKLRSWGTLSLTTWSRVCAQRQQSCPWIKGTLWKQLTLPQTSVARRCRENLGQQRPCTPQSVALVQEKKLMIASTFRTHSLYHPPLLHHSHLPFCHNSPLLHHRHPPPLHHHRQPPPLH